MTVAKVPSIVLGEGNESGAYAGMGHRTLIIDGDTRRWGATQLMTATLASQSGKVKNVVIELLSSAQDTTNTMLALTRDDVMSLARSIRQYEHDMQLDEDDE